MSSSSFSSSFSSSSLSLAGFIFFLLPPLSLSLCNSVFVSVPVTNVHTWNVTGRAQVQDLEAEAAGERRAGSETLTPGCLLHRLGPDRYIPINQSTFVASVLGPRTPSRAGGVKDFTIPRLEFSPETAHPAGRWSPQRSCCVSWNPGTHLVWEIFYLALCENL